VFLMGLAPCAAGAQGFALPAVSFAAGGTGLTTFYVLGFELGPWQEYLAQELTPNYLLPENAVPVHVSWLRDSDVKILPDFASFMESNPATYFYLNVKSQTAGQNVTPLSNDDQTVFGNKFERQYFSPGIEHRLNENGVLGVAAVIAYQRFSSASLGMMLATTPDNEFLPRARYGAYEEKGYGTGVRLDLRQEIFQGLAFETGFQSRINMEEFAAFRGVYANPADLDIPARAHVGLDFRTSGRSWLNVAVERVMYSDINAFPSRYLPNRFLSLLGDSTSPAFRWEDLTVYSVGWTWSNGADEQWQIGVSTRPQPSPTSTVLNRALQGDLAKSAMTVGYSRRTGRTSRLNFNAAYAPSEYAFGGSVLGVTTDSLDQRFEAEALWIYAF